MPTSLLEGAEERLLSWFEKGNPHDVFVLVKGFVSDSSLCQPALLCLPGCRVDTFRVALCRLAKSDAPCTLFGNGWCAVSGDVWSVWGSVWGVWVLDISVGTEILRY